jgi:hypothetical protein
MKGKHFCSEQGESERDKMRYMQTQSRQLLKNPI